MNSLPRRFLLLLTFSTVFLFSVSAQDTPLGEVASKLNSIKLKDSDFPYADVPFLAQQLLSQMKQGLRQEIFDALQNERLASAPPEALRDAILRSLRASNVEIWSPDPNEKADDVSDLYGRLLKLDVSTPKGHPDLLAFQTDLSIPCGDDSSLYIFQRKETGWRMVISREQDNYTLISDARGQFAFHVSPPDAAGDWFVVTVDVNPWCTSNWQSIRYEVLRPTSFAPDRPLVLLAEERGVYLGRDDVFDLSVRKDGFQTKHAGSQSLDAGLLTRDHVENYSLSGNRVRRIPPFAFRPEDFLDEWLDMPWEDAKVWVRAGKTPDAQTWRAKLEMRHSARFTTEFDFVQPCPPTPGVSRWQIGLLLEKLGTPVLPANTPNEVFFEISKTGDKFFVDDVATTRPTGCPGNKRPQGF